MFMRFPAIPCSLALAALLTGGLRADDQNKQLYADLVAPILNAKCVSCHGEEKQKGKLRVDTVAFMMEGESLVPGKPDESILLERVYLPLDDDDHMPPEDEPQLTKQEVDVLTFWVKAGAKEKGTIAEAKPDKDAAAAIAHVIGNLPKPAASVAKADAPKELTEEQKKAVETAIGNVDKSGASLMAIAQNTPELRYSALNITKEFKDENLAALKPVAEQVKWIDLARTGVTDKGLAHLSGMKNLTRLHLENTPVTDAGLDSLKGLANLEYLNLYGTQVSDAGIAKLSGLKNLKKIFLWQSKVTDAGATKLAAAIPGIDVNTGWKASSVEPVALAANTTKPAAKPADKPTPPAKPKTDPKPAPKPAPKPEPKKPTPPTPKPEPKPAPKPAQPDPTFEKALNELKAAAAKTSKEAADAKAAFDAAIKTVADATKKAEELKAKSETAAKVAAETKAALAQLEKAAAVKK